MKQKLLLLLAISISMVSSAWALEQMGNGVYLIGTAQDLKDFATTVNGGVYSANAVLTTNIDLNNEAWTSPIGSESHPYTGTFDGQGFTISKFTFTTTANNTGFFGNLGNGAVVKNFTIEGSINSTHQRVGVIGSVGSASSAKSDITTISYIHSKINLTCTQTRHGGILGAQNGPGTVNIDHCIYSGTFTTDNVSGNFGGIVGLSYNNTSSTMNITNCLFDGTIDIGTGDNAGGIVGYTRSCNLKIENCLSVGDITATHAGQFVGQINSTSYMSFAGKNYYIDGNVQGTGSAGPKSGSTTPETVTTEQLKSGSLCYTLNGNTSNGQGWYQTLTGANKEDYPTPIPSSTSLKVYYDTTDYLNFTDNQVDIADENDLQYFATVVNAGGFDLNGLLTANIDMTSIMTTWRPIGNWGQKGVGVSSAAYKGHFNGQGHAITNFTGTTLQNYYGLFGVISTGCLIEDFSISGTISNADYQYAGGVAAYARDATPTIRNVRSSVSINNTNSSSRLGGILGGALNGTTIIQACTYTGTIHADNITGNYGGIVAYVNTNADAHLTISNCLFDGTVEDINGGEGECGGIIGFASTKSDTKIENCLSVGTVSSTKQGMICGIIAGTKTFTNNFYKDDVDDLEANGPDSNAAYTATAVTTAELASGEVAYWLNGSVNAGTNWYQTLPASPSGDATPTLDSTHGLVYLNGTVCPDTGAPQGSVSYSNAEGTTIGSHSYTDGFCTYCNYLQSDYITPTDGYYMIGNEKQLKWFAALVNTGTYNAKAKLTGDIDMTDVTWTPIGTGSGNVAPGETAYTGIFDGQGYGITGFSAEGAGHIGLFGDADGATIKNFSISGDLTVTEGYCAGVVANLTNSTIENIHSALTVSIPNTGVHHVGGIVGSARGSNTISGCSFAGSMTVTGSTDNFAGIAAYITNYDNVINCANYGNVTFSASACAAGGVVGYLNSASAYVQNCLNIGTVTFSGEGDPKYGGAIVGRLRTHTASYITNHFWLEDSGYGAAKNNDGTVILTTAPEVTTSQLASGEITYKLGSDWYQTLTGVEPDTKPTLDSSHGQVILNGSYENVASTLALGETKSFGTNSNFDVTSVTMDRTLKGGKWNTFCVPFDMSSSEISSQLGTDTEVKELTGVTDNGDGNYTLTFSEASSIEAGKPYMVKVPSNVSSISLSSKTIKGTIIPITVDDNITFTGVFNNGNAPEDSYIISNNKFYQVNSTVALKAFRGYLAVGGGGEVKELNYFIEDDDADGIDMVNGEGFMVNGPIYNLSGQRINKLQKGINIVNGKKVLF